MSENESGAGLLPTPERLTLDEIAQRFNTDEKAVAYLEALLWPNGPVCPHCQNADPARLWKIKASAAVRVGLYECAACQKQFRVTVGTIFEDSHIPLRKWLVAFYLVSSSKKGISSLQLQRNLDLGSYRTALFMTHRIRYALTSPQFSEPLSGDVEVDSTYVGGKESVGELRKQGPTFIRHPETQQWVRRPMLGKKMEVLSLQQRGGDKRSIVTDRVSAKALLKVLHDHVAPGSTLHTDNTHLLKRKVDPTKFKHHVVTHSKKEYARKLPDGSVTHVNTLESSFGLLKRGLYGTFHSVSKKHLHRYVAEFDFRWNARKKSDGERTVAAVRGAKGKRLMLKEPTGKSRKA